MVAFHILHTPSGTALLPVTFPSSRRRLLLTWDLSVTAPRAAEPQEAHSITTRHREAMCHLPLPLAYYLVPGEGASTSQGQERGNKAENTTTNFPSLLFCYFIRGPLTPLHKGKGKRQKTKWFCHQKPSPHRRANTCQCKSCLFIKSSYPPAAKHTRSLQTIFFQCFEVPFSSHEG